MMRLILVLSVIAVLMGAGCAAKTPKKAPPASSDLPEQASLKPAPPPVSPAADPEETASGPKKSKLNPDVVHRGLEVFELTFRNNDKKAKVEYGRNYRHLPKSLQFAYDLRFKNYEHAIGLIPELPYPPEQKAFWEKILNKKPKNIASAICDELVGLSSYPPSKPESGDRGIPEEEIIWTEELTEFVAKTLEKEKPNVNQWWQPDKDRTEIAAKIDKIQCRRNETTKQRECDPLSEELRKEIMTDKFFDFIRNRQRRDTRFMQENARNLFNRIAYKKYVQPTQLLTLYRVLQATNFDRRAHFEKRLRGIAKDIRPQDLLSRMVGDTIISDHADRRFADRINEVMMRNQLVTGILGFETELASCNLSKGRQSD